ncbi:MAG: acetyl-CoA carboxylase biotin carboxyl carrier protein subunit [Vicinamibacteria bacterium]|nr:acetyl-CoA carboxylase biotin carboxyl carrier protein subunit [Vicinamibacteria bacterium]
MTIGEKMLELDLVRAGNHYLSVLVDGVSHDVGIEKTAEGFAVLMRGDRFDVEIKDAVKGAVLGRATHHGPLKLTAPMPGKIVKVLVREGESVEAGHGVLVMEAMKMENELKANKAGKVQEIKVQEGQAVEMGALLLVIG